MSTDLQSNERETVHARVSRAYQNAIERSKDAGGCCPSADGEPAGVAARTAGYGDDLEGLPDGVVRSSFGCGNPLAFDGVEEGQTVLDLGSGAGLDLLIAARRVGPSGRVIGVDMTDAMIEVARGRVETAGATQVEVRKGLIEDLPVDDGSVDWAISNCVINLSPDKPAVFREIARVLRPGGRLSVSDIVAEDLPQELLDHAAAHDACISGALSEAEYVSGLEQAGLVDVQIVDRQVYDREQLEAIVRSDLEDLGVEPADLIAAVGLAVGKVASVRVTARRP